MPTSSSSKNNYRLNYEDKYCKCGSLADIRVTRNPQNRGLLYYTCRMGECNYFSWCTPINAEPWNRLKHDIEEVKKMSQKRKYEPEIINKCVVEEVSSKHLYDVFLNFRGDDTRDGFTGYLYNALVKENIKAFMDAEDLHMGDHISQVFQAIEQSRMSILVFSENYATSEWCLNELVKILDCMDSKGQVVLPVFYKVTPSVVRNQTGSYGKAMADHEITYGGQMNYKVCKWRSALEKASNIIGRELKEGRYEYKFIEEIIAIVSAK